jgi:YHS domain-containing protein
MTTSKKIPASGKKSAAPRRFATLCGRVFIETDPACFPSVRYRGRTIHFCTEACLDAFLADPVMFQQAHRNPGRKKDFNTNGEDGVYTSPKINSVRQV